MTRKTCSYRVGHKLSRKNHIRWQGIKTIVPGVVQVKRHLRAIVAVTRAQFPLTNEKNTKTQDGSFEQPAGALIIVHVMLGW